MSTYPITVKKMISQATILCLLFTFAVSSVQAEGTKQLSPDSTKECLLHTNAPDFGNFAEFGASDTSSLFIRINDVTGDQDTVYIGLSELVDGDGLPVGATYFFRIIDPMGNVAAGPFPISPVNANANTWSLASTGPDALNPGGYATTQPYSKFVPTMTGDYRLEFSITNVGQPNVIVNVKWFDFTVGNSGMEMPGRLWSRAWSLRTPQVGMGNTPPDCEFNRDFAGTLFSYTMDGFVSKIDFDSSGFQGLSFNVAFGINGPGTSGDIVVDRQSIKGMNATLMAADHMVFVSEPDSVEFPSAVDPCGIAMINAIQCFSPDSFCIEVTVTRMGQVEILLDFANNNGEFDPDTTDVLLALAFDTAGTACIFWDGLKGDGSPIGFGEVIPAFIRYAQGVQHYASYDVELLKFGYCVETVRPICPGASTELLYWDDTNITDDQFTGSIDEGDPGTGQPKMQLDGCTCGVDSCRTWTTFQVGDPASPNCVGTPYGYGEGSTLNTWWFASTLIEGPMTLAVTQVEIVGDTTFCPGDSTELTAMGTPDTVSYMYDWSGPGGFSAMTETITASLAGVYSVTITDTSNNCVAFDSVTVLELTPPALTLDFTCVGMNMQNGNIDLTVVGAGPPFIYNWSNGDTTEDLTNVPPGTYIVTVTDTNGCVSIDSATVENCCTLTVSCPASPPGTFSCIDDIPAIDTTVVNVTEFCDSFTITAFDMMNMGSGCADDTLVVTRTYFVSDAAGNSTQCIQLFNIVDDLAPVVVGECPGDTSIACTESIDTSLLGVPMYMDACDGVILTVRDDSTGFDGTCTANVLGQVTRTFFAADSCGNVDSSCVQVISVIDTIAPTFTTPADITIECDQDTLPASTGEVTDTTDNCTAITLTFADIVVPGPCEGTDTIQRTWTATDACGNSSTGLQTITREDTTPPTFTVPVDVTIDCAGDSTPASTGDVTDAMDNCAAVTVTFSDLVVPDGCPVNDTIFRTWIATDACGNSTTEVQTIARLDTVAPMFTVPADVTIACDADTSQASTGAVTDTTDNCSSVTLTVMDMIVPGPCEGTDTILRTFTATDLCMNSNVQVQTIVREDNEAPMITFCPADTTIDCDAATDTTALGSITALDNCSSTVTILFFDVPAGGNCTGDAPIVRTFVATDACGNSSSCEQLINLQDTLAPTVTSAPGNTSVECTASIDTADLGVPTYSDNCSSDVILSFSDDSTGFDGMCLQGVLGEINRTFFAEDSCGNIDSSVVQVIQVIDITPPSLTVPADTIIDCGLDTLPATTGQATASDNCGFPVDISFFDAINPNGCPAVDTITRTWVATDACGNSTGGVQIIIRTDTVAPTFTTPADTTIECDDPTDPTFTGEILDTLDNCSSIIVDFSDNILPNGCPQNVTIERTWIVSDDCGNSSTDLQVITVLDTEPPMFTVPADVTIECDASTSPDATGEPASVVDNCGATTVTFTDASVPGVCPITEVITRTWVVEDECGNTNSQTQLISLIDTLAPVVLTCPPDTVFECAAPADTLGLPTYSDNCSMVMISFRDDSTGFVPPSNTGVIMRVFFGEDECGNIDSSCVQTITIEDNTPPMITCPADTTLECTEVADTSVTGFATATDNCTAPEDITFTFSDDSTGFDMPCFEGTIARVFIAQDQEGNTSSCTQLITIVDTTPPVFTVPVDVTVDCDADIGDLTLTGEVDTATVVDCSEVGDVTFSDGPLSDGCDATGTIVRTWTVADACGNIASQTQLITLVDTIPPMVSVPDDITLACTDDPTDTGLTGVATATDNCSLDLLISFVDTQIEDGCGVTGIIQREWQVEDECGNIGTGIQLITIEDNDPPIAVCQDITIDFDMGDVTISPEDVDGGSFDECGEVTLTLSQTMFSCLAFVDDSIQTVQLTVTDLCGNTAVCDVQVTGSGGTGLAINCPDDIFVNLGPGLCEAVVNYVVTVDPLCGSLDSVIIEQVDTSGLTSGDYFPIGTTVQTYIAYTPFGDTVSCSFNITVVEHPEGPFVACNDTVNISVDQNCEAFVGTDMILEGDEYGCYDDFLVEIEGIGSGFGGVLVNTPEFGNFFNVTVTNEAGASCWGTITFEDKIPPLLTCIDVTLSCLDDTEPVFTDPIEGTLEFSESPGSPIGPGGGVVTTQEFEVVAPNGAQVTDINVLVDLTHTWSSDIDAVLIAPDGSEVELATDVCGTGDDWGDVVFDDEAATPVASACTGGVPVLTGPVQPEGMLSDFDGFNATGTWTLQITDDTGGDGGTLNTAGLEIAYFVAQPYAPIAFDACGEVTLEYEETETGDECDTVTITRVWTATDESGNTASCVQTIDIVPLTLAGLEFPENYEGACGSSDLPSVTGYPTLNGVNITENGICNILSGYHDKPLSGCGGGIKIIRTWTVLDWCAQEVVEAEQVIKLTDEEPPVIICPPDQTVGADPWNCTADVDLVAPEVEDLCGSAFSVTAESSNGTVVDLGGVFKVTDLPLGITTITWIAEDECGNSASCTYEIEVIDDVPPVPLCDEFTVISLTEDQDLSQGLTKMDAEDFDSGSYDNCSDVTFEARRMDSCIDFDWTTGGAGVDEIPNGIVNSSDRGTTFRTKVPFACCDVGNGPVMVELRVRDAAGNTNSCMVEVEVQDKLDPFLIPPPDVTVSCDFWFDQAETNGFVDQSEDVLTPVFGKVLDAFTSDDSDREDIIIDDPGNDQLPQPYNWGKDGWADDNCAVNVEVRVQIFDDCSGEGLPGNPPPGAVRLIRRTFRAVDAQGNDGVENQFIWVVDFDPFYISDVTCFNEDRNDGVIWPCDELYDFCPQEIPVNYPQIFDDNCSQVAVTFDDTRFDFVDDVCYKILRKWTVIDWCQYDAQEGTGIWFYTQEIKVIDDEPAAILGCYPEPITRSVLDRGVTLPDNNQALIGEDNPLSTSCSVHITDTLRASEFCSSEVTYDVKVFPFNGQDFLQIHEKRTVPVDSNGFADLVLNTKTSDILAVRLNGLPYNDKLCDPIIGGDKDYHRVLWSVEDGCGNINTCSYLMRLEDRKQPTPVCVGLSSVVMDNGSVTIWAQDFNASSFDDCTKAEDLVYSFRGDEYTPGKEFNCDSILLNGGPTFLVEIWVADEGNDLNCDGVITWAERNKDFCSTFAFIEDNDTTCMGAAPISGQIETEESATVADVKVTLRNALGIEMETYTTDIDGMYFLFNPLLDHEITPDRNDDHKNGVSTLDLVGIQKHLLGLEPFTSPYKIIAADANNSQSVSAIDLVEIRKLLLGQYTEFPNNESWRFVDAEFEFTDEANPWPFAEVINVTPITGDNTDFVAVKVGDVNGTVSANIHGDDNEIITRSPEAGLILTVEDRQVSPGEIVSVDIKSGQFESIVGYQMTLMTDGLQLADIRPGMIDVSEDNIAVHKGAIAMSWHRVEGISVQEDDVLFSLTFNVVRESKLSNMLDIGSTITRAEAYSDRSSEIDVVPVSIVFEATGAQSAVEFALYQNAPNPFRDVTTIGFDMPESDEAILTFYDITGKVIHQIEGEYAKGFNQVDVKSAQFQASGVIYYQLETGEFSATKRMILLD